MPQNFIACDREQALLLPPSLLDWVPPDHLVWTVLASVEEMDLSGFYGVYRPDGHGRPAYDPKVVVALLFYACAQGIRSSRAIERRCREDVAFMVITAMRVPDHSTIAEFRQRHERALAGLFTDVLGMCEKAGLVKVGVIAIDGTKISANASMGANRSYERIARELLDELEETDRREDELHGRARGDELPEQLRTPEGRRTALREAKHKLDAEREAAGEEGGALGDEGDADGEEQRLVAFDLDRERILNSEQGRRGWMREGRRQLDELRRQQARPIAASRADRLRESKRRLEEEHRVELEANAAYEAYKARGVMRDGRRFGKPPKPYVPPAKPTGTINPTDHDSRIVRTTGQPARQGYNAQAAVTDHQVIIAAEVTIDSPDFGHLEPMVDATQRELEAIGVSSLPETVVADPGYWHKPQMENIVTRGIQVLIPPDSGLRTQPRPGWNKGLYAFMRTVLSTEFGQAVYRRRMATVEPVFGQIKFNRGFDRFQRRGLSAVTSEWRLAAAAHNLLKLHKHQIAATAA
jgi:transposase